MSDDAMKYQDIQEEMPDLSDEGVETFGSRVYSEGESVKKGKTSETAAQAKAKIVDMRIGDFLTRKLGEMAVRSADVAGNW